jgi:hypothetical protein
MSKAKFLCAFYANMPANQVYHNQNWRQTNFAVQRCQNDRQLAICTYGKLHFWNLTVRLIGEMFFKNFKN